MNKEKPVLVTGATGYVAGWIVKKLLDEGYTVHAAVRNPNDSQKLSYLNALAAHAPGNIKYFKADLLTEGSYEEAMQGCEVVFHTASPFLNKVKDNQRDLVDPALIGTRNVLHSVNKTESIKRVVLTSSCASIIGDAIDCEHYPNGIATEAQWNTTSTLHHQPYNFSKVVAERAAWEINKAQNRWDLICINPSLVIGPGINPISTSESFNIVRQMGNGTTRFGIPEMYLGVVDVRDLAELHYLAAVTPHAQGRFIASAENTNFLYLSQTLKNKFGNKYPFATRNLPKALVWLMAPLAGFKRKMISKNVGHIWKVDNTKGKKELGIQYRPIETSIVDFFQQMIDNKLV